MDHLHLASTSSSTSLFAGTHPGGVEQRYQYDAVGNRTTMALVGTGTFSYDYDAVDRLKTMVTPVGERYTQQYDADSRRTTLLLGLGSKREYRYDSVGRITTQIEYNAAGQRIYTMVDSYDAVGNRVGRVTNGNATTWLYDDAYRLIRQEKSDQRATFAYDANSNLTTKWHQGSNPQTMVYDAADRLTTMQVGGTTGTMSWFSRGAMRNQYETGAIKATYSYTDINNNLRVAQDSAGLTTSTYDGDNLRRKIVAGSLTTTFVWDGADYLQIKPSSGDATLLVVLEGEVVGHVKGSEKRDYIVDPLGSVVAYLNSSQTLTDQFEYWPYGELIAEIEADTEPFLWVGSLGYFRDSDLRTYIRAREYRQDLGSWMQLDPLWPDESAWNYCAASPTLDVDPTGLRPNRWWEHRYWQEWPTYSEPIGPVPLPWPFGAGHLPCVAFDCVQCFREARVFADNQFNIWVEANTKGGLPGGNGVGNAIAHCNSACEATRRCGQQCAQTMTDRHEQQWFNILMPTATFLDLHNNSIGIQLGQHGQNASCVSLCANVANLLEFKGPGLRGSGFRRVR